MSNQEIVCNQCARTGNYGIECICDMKKPWWKLTVEAYGITEVYHHTEKNISKYIAKCIEEGENFFCENVTEAEYIAYLRNE